MDQLKRLLALFLIIAMLPSLVACGAVGRLCSASRALTSTPYRLSTKTTFRSDDPECALLLSELGGTALPLTVDGERVMVSTVLDSGMRLTLRVIDDSFYYLGEMEGNTIRLRVVLSDGQESELKERFSGGVEIDYSSFDSVERGGSDSDEIYICRGLDSEVGERLRGQLYSILLGVCDGEPELLDVTMSCRLDGEGRFRFITVNVRFALTLSGERVEATMITEESYVYTGELSVDPPEDAHLYEEVGYDELFGADAQ